jgi:glycosyltransferase involved in cell wall biosynthesis
MARIALLMQDFSGGGAERMMVNIAEGLAARSHEVEIVTVRPEGPYRDRVPPHIPVIALGPRRVSLAIPALARHLRRQPPDAALSTLVHMNVAAVLARDLARIPMRLVLREAMRIGEAAGDEKRRLIRLAYRLLPWAYSRSDHVIAISEGLTSEVVEVTGLSRDRVTTIYNPVLSAGDLATLNERSEPPHPWLTDSTCPVILSVGRLVPQKDHATLLDAFAQLRRERPARLVILGAGTLRSELEGRARRLGVSGHVHFAGFTGRPFAWMSHADLLVHTARWEGFGNVLVEALACGLPVVATDCPSGPSEILEGGRYGRLVPVGDVEAVGIAMAEALNAPHSKEFLKQRAAEFTVEAIVDRYEKVLLVAR